MGDPSAILAINSLDRYITNTINFTNQYEAFWFPTTTSITYNFFGLLPTIGASVVGDIAKGWPTGIVLITALGPGSTFTINKPTTNTTFSGSTVVTETVSVGSAAQPSSNSLTAQYLESTPFSNNFTIQSPGALIYGYIDRIVVSQIQLQYNIPTVAEGKNDVLWLQAPQSSYFTATWTSGSSALTLVSGNPGVGTILLSPASVAGLEVVSVVGFTINLIGGVTTGAAASPQAVTATSRPVSITIPHGFYDADELAAVAQTLIAALGGFWVTAAITVVFTVRDGFVFTSTSGYNFYFPNPDTVLRYNSLIESRARILKTYRLYGMTVLNSDANKNGVPIAPRAIQESQDYPNFLYTPYIDFYSDVLTNYQLIKDTNTSIEKTKGMVARVYVSGAGNIQVTGSVSALGTAPFVMTSDLNSPKVIRWSPDVAIPSIDFKLQDCYGELIPGAEQGYSSEFQMTLLCFERS